MLLVRANHPDHPTAADNLALVANLFNRRSDLHSRFSLLQLLNDPAAAWIVRHQRHSNPVPDDHADKIASHGARQVRRHLVTLTPVGVELDPNQMARQQLEDDALGRPILRLAHVFTFARSGLAPATPTHARPRLPALAPASTRGSRPRSPRPCARSAPTGPCLS